MRAQPANIRRAEDANGPVGGCPVYPASDVLPLPSPGGRTNRMTHRTRLRAGPVPTLAAAAFLSACSTSVVGTGSPAGAPAAEPTDESPAASAGPLDDLLGGLPLHEELGEHLAVADLASHPDGGAVLLA